MGDPRQRLPARRSRANRRLRRVDELGRRAARRSSAPGCWSRSPRSSGRRDATRAGGATSSSADRSRRSASGGRLDGGRPARHAPRPTASSRTGIPFRNAIPASRSRSSGSEEASRLTLTPPAAFGVRQPPSVPPAVRDGDRARRDLVGDPRGQLDRAVGRADPAAARRPRSRGRRRRRDGSAPRARGRRASAASRCASRSCGSAARAGRSAAAGSPGRRRSAPPAARASALISGGSSWTRVGRGGGSSCRGRRRAGARRGRSRAGCGAASATLSPPRRRPKRSPLGPVRSSRSTRRRGESRIPDAAELAQPAGARGDDARSARRSSSMISHSCRASPGGLDAPARSSGRTAS